MASMAGYKSPGKQYFIETLVSPQSKSLFKTFKGRSPSSCYESKGFLMKNPVTHTADNSISAKFKMINNKITQSCPAPKEKPPLSSSERMRLSSTIDTKPRAFDERGALPFLASEKRENSAMPKGKALESNSLSSNASPLLKGKENFDYIEARGLRGPTTPAAAAAYIGNKALFASNPQAKSLIKGFAVDTDMGLVRNYNEDRVTVVYNYQQPKGLSGGKWPHISYFGLFDGHGGKTCADYLRDNLHNLVRIEKFNFLN